MAPPAKTVEPTAGADRSRRRYDMGLRGRQVDETSRRIVAALVALVGETPTNPDSISVSDVARRADVSVATIYRHFGTKDALFGAIASVAFEEFSGSSETPRLDTLADNLRSMFGQMQRHEGFVRATLTQQEFGREVRRRREPDRTSMVAGLIEPASERLDAEQTAGLGVLVRLLTSALAYIYLTDKGGYRPDEAAALVAWAVDTLVRAAEAAPPPSSGTEGCF